MTLVTSGDVITILPNPDHSQWESDPVPSFLLGASSY